MKQYTATIAALTAVIMSLTSCGKFPSTGDFRNAPYEIRFAGGGIGLETKSFVQTVDDDLQQNGFNVAAVIDADGSVMFNSTVTYDETSSSYGVEGKRYYYPLDGTMTFYAVYPVSQKIDVDGLGIATIEYENDTDCDLVYATAREMERRSDKITFSFNHLLSQVTVKCRGENPYVDYLLKSITITAADSGTYLFDELCWIPGGSTSDYTVFSDEDGMTIGTDSGTSVGEDMSFIPGTVKLKAEWECYNKGSSVLLSKKEGTVEIELTRGDHFTFTLLLPFDSPGMNISQNVASWLDRLKELEVEEISEPMHGVFTVNDMGKKVRFAPGNLYWDGENFALETSQLAFTTAWNPGHVDRFYWSSDPAKAVALDYNDPSASKTDKFFASDGKAVKGYTVLSEKEWEYIFENSMAKCEEIKEFVDMENDEFFIIGDYDDASRAYLANEYIRSRYGDNLDVAIEDEFIQMNDVFRHTVDGVKCIILTPDDFTGEVWDSYSAEEWADAESAYGLVALPLSGVRHGSDITLEYELSAHTPAICERAYYWTGTNHNADSSCAYSASLFYNGAHVHIGTRRKEGSSVRPVMVL